MHVADLCVVDEVADLHAVEREVPLEDVARSGALLADQQPLLQQVVEAMRRHGEMVRGRADADVVLRAVARVLVLLLRVVALDERELDAARGEHLQELLRVAEDEPDIALWMGAEHARKRVHDGVLADRHRHAERDLLDAGHLAPKLCQELLFIILHRDEALAQDLPGRRQRELLVLVAEQRHAIRFLDEVDVLRDGGLRDVQELRRPREVHRLTDTEKGGNAEVQHVISSLSIRLSY